MPLNTIARDISFTDSTTLDSFSRVRVSEVSQKTFIDFPYGITNDPKIKLNIGSAIRPTITYNSTNRSAIFSKTTATTGVNIITITSANPSNLKVGYTFKGYISFKFLNTSLLTSTELTGVGFGGESFDSVFNGGYLLLANSTGYALRTYSTTFGGTSTNTVNRSSWDDKLDGTGPSGLTIDFTKAQIFFVKANTGYDFSTSLSTGSLAAGAFRRVFALKLPTTSPTTYAFMKVILKSLKIINTGSVPLYWELRAMEAIPSTSTSINPNSILEINTTVSTTTTVSSKIVALAGFAASGEITVTKIPESIANGYPIDETNGSVPTAERGISLWITPVSSTTAVSANVTLNYKEIYLSISYNTIGAQASSSNLTNLSTLTYASTSFVKMTGANTFTLDTNTYLTTSAAASTYQPIDADLTSWAGVTRASGFDTFAATPSSANLISLITDETGTGALVFANSPALSGTPTAPTATANDNSTKLATTAYVDNAVSAGGGLTFNQVQRIAFLKI